MRPCHPRLVAAVLACAWVAQGNAPLSTTAALHTANHEMAHTNAMGAKDDYGRAGDDDGAHHRWPSQPNADFRAAIGAADDYGGARVLQATELLSRSTSSHQHPWLASILTMAFLCSIVIMIITCSADDER